MTKAKVTKKRAVKKASPARTKTLGALAKEQRIKEIKEGKYNVVRSPIQIKSPWSVSTNAIWVPVRGRLVTSNEYKQYIRDLGLELLAQHLPQFLTTLPILARVYLFPPDTKVRRDIDNWEKSLFDGLVSNGVLLDDRFIKKMLVIDCPPVQHGAIIIELENFDPREDNAKIIELMNRFKLIPYYDKKTKTKMKKERKQND